MPIEFLARVSSALFLYASFLAFPVLADTQTVKIAVDLSQFPPLLVRVLMDHELRAIALAILQLIYLVLSILLANNWIETLGYMRDGATRNVARHARWRKRSVEVASDTFDHAYTTESWCVHLVLAAYLGAFAWGASGHWFAAGILSATGLVLPFLAPQGSRELMAKFWFALIGDIADWESRGADHPNHHRHARHPDNDRDAA